MKGRVTFRSAVWLAFVGCGGQGLREPPSPARAEAVVPNGPADAEAPPPASPSPTLLSNDQAARARALVAQAEPFFAAHNNTSPSLTVDGRRVFFFSNRSGTVRLYGADVARPTEPAWPVGDGAGRAQWAAPTRDGKWVVYMQDLEIFRALPDGTHATSLTPGEHVPRYFAPLPRDRPGTLVYSVVTDEHPPSTKLVGLDVEKAAARVLRTDAGELPVAAVTADASRALALRTVGDLEQQVFELPLGAAGAPRRIYPPEGTKARVAGVAYSADGRRVFVATDEGGEGASVIALEAATGAIAARHRVEPKTAGAWGLEVSPAGDRLALSVDLGNRNEVRVLDARTLKPAVTVAIPPGTAYPTAFTRDGKSFGLYFSTPERPGDVYRVETATGKVEPLRKEARPSLPGIAARIEGVPSFDGMTVPVNVYLPATPPAGKLGTLVFLHGGPDDSARVGWRPRYAFLASLGVAVVEPNIRGSTGFGRAYVLADHREKRGAALRDVEAVRAWALAQPWCDPARIALSGHSYGAYLTMLALGQQPTLWRAGVALSGSVDQARFLRSLPPDVRTRAAADFGDPDTENDLVERYSPIRFFDRVKAPLFVWQGEKDPVVKLAEAESAATLLRARGIPVEYMLAAGQGHVPSGTAAEVELIARVGRFLEEQGITTPR